MSEKDKLYQWYRDSNSNRVVFVNLENSSSQMKLTDKVVNKELEVEFLKK